MNHHFIATTGFGIESVVKRELEKLDMKQIQAEDGKVHFFGPFEDMAKANVWLRTAERVLWCLADCTATTFDELFDEIYAIPWPDFLPENANMHVNGKSVKSQLSSVPACQSIAKKAIIKKMQTTYKVRQFKENGPTYTILISLLKDRLTVTIDTSGDGLFQRGYREKSLIAPIKETLAAAMISLSYWDKHRIFLDPLCGSGTLPIEAAYIAKNIAPGLSRHFVAETWPHIEQTLFKQAKKHAYEQMEPDFNPQIYASDHSTDAYKQSRENMRKAGVDDAITLKQVAINELALPGDYGVVVTNPPYGERLGTPQAVKELYREMGRKFSTEKTWSTYVITAHEDFEVYFGRKANAKRKLFNGRIKTDFYQFYGQRPPKELYPDAWFRSHESE